MHKAIPLLCLLLLGCGGGEEPRSTAPVPPTAPVSEAAMPVPPDTVYLKDRPAPVTVPIARTEAEAAGHMVKWAWGRDSIEVIFDFPLAPVQSVAPALLRTPSGEPVLHADGRPIRSGDGGGRGSMETLTADQGLAIDAVVCSMVDHLGNLWIGTQGGGVSRYDGHGFTNFTTAQGLADNSVNNIIEGPDGHIWMSTQGAGVSRYDGRSFTIYTTDDGLPGNTINDMAADRNGRIWIGTVNGLTCYDGRSFKTYTTEDGLLGNDVTGLATDLDGHLWIGSNPSGVSRFDGKSFTVYTTEDGLPDGSVTSIVADRQGVIWIGTQAGLSRFDGKSFSTVYVRFGEIPMNIKVLCLLVDRSGNLWSGRPGGLLRYDGESFTDFGIKQGLMHDDVRCLTEDLSGNIWIGTFGGGLARYAGPVFASYTKEDGLADNLVMAITEDKDGKLWFGTGSGGVTTYDGSVFESYGGYQGLAGNTVTSIVEDSAGAIWIGIMGGGLSRYDGKTFVNYNTEQGLVSNEVLSLLIDQAGRLWLGTSGGLSRFDGESFVNYTTVQGLASNPVNSMVEDETGHLWLGTRHGVQRFDGSSFVNYTTADGLGDDMVFHITKDAVGNIWVSTIGGVSLLPRAVRDSLPRGKMFERFTKRDGLPDNIVAAVLVGDSGMVYVGTNAGFCELLSAPGTPKGVVVGRTFNSATGYPVKDVNQWAMYRDSHGLIWIGTGSARDGLVRFDPKALHDDPDPPRVLIQGVRLHEEPVCWNALLPRTPGDSAALALAMFSTFSDTVSEDVLRAHRHSLAGVHLNGVASWYPVPQDLVLPYAHNHITFDFAAIKMGRNAMVRYQYMLEGYDADWGPVTASRSAGFGNMREGSYTFKVKARSPQGVWSDPVTYTFEVLPPWYRTWWMYILYMLGGAAAIGGYVRWRMRAVKRENLLLENKVALRTRQLAAENKKSNDLLLNILPVEVAEELKAKGEADARLIEEVTVLFTDFAGFTAMSEKVSPQALVKDLHECFTAFDHIMGRHGLEKIKTIGDSYMAAGGLPTPNDTHAGDAVRAAMEMRDFIAEGKARKQAAGLPWFEVRIGIHTGPVVAGIVGVKKFSYDIWGDTVNTASRMEQNGEPGKVNISAATYERVKDNFRCTFRGEIAVKGKGEMKMYFVEPADRQE